MVFKYTKIEEIPETKRSVVERMIKNGLLDIDYNGNFEISEDMLKILIILDRLDLI